MPRKYIVQCANNLSRQNKSPCAILLSDLHLSLNPPIYRALESDWILKQSKMIHNVRLLAKELLVPVLIAGDVFDKNTNCEKLVNSMFLAFCGNKKDYGDTHYFAIEGQHDVPFHDTSLYQDTAIWTLSKMDSNFIYLNPNSKPKEVNNLILHPFGWDKQLVPLEKKTKGKLNIALVHHFLWLKDKEETAFTGASEGDTTEALRDFITSFDVTLFGDNHTAFTTRLEKTLVVNHGNFMVRRLGEKTPKLKVLCSDKTIVSFPYHETQFDIFDNNMETKTKNKEGIETLSEALSKNKDFLFDFAEEVKREATRKKVQQRTKQILQEVTNGQ